MCCCRLIGAVYIILYTNWNRDSTTKSLFNWAGNIFSQSLSDLIKTEETSEGRDVSERLAQKCEQGAWQKHAIP